MKRTLSSILLSMAAMMASATFVSAQNDPVVDKIIEIGAVVMKNGKEISRMKEKELDEA